MTKKDFVLIAKSIKSLDLDPIARRSAAEVFADNLMDTNPNFDRSRFIAACLRKGEKL